MGAARDEVPDDTPVPFQITAAGLRALGRHVPVGLDDGQAVNQSFLQAIACRHTSAAAS